MARAAQFDAIVIGAGQAGGPLSKELAGAGWKTALVEKARMGGTCINWGCTPTKTLVASARVSYLARRARDYGVRTGPVGVDMQAVRRRKRAIVKKFGGVKPEEARKVTNRTVLAGEACFTGPHELEVALASGEKRRIGAETIFINTGARPARPALPGLDDVDFLDSTSIQELDRVPEHLLVLGGGYIGVEFAHMFRRFGSRVTIVQRSGALLAREDPDVAEAVAGILREDGIELVLGAEALGVSPRRGGLRLEVRAGRSTRQLSGSDLLVATGRVPNTDRLGLDAAGIAVDARGHVVVDERLETSVKGVYALGDVNGGPAFTHISYDDYRIVTANLLRNGRARTTGRLVPYTVFLDPELGRVGLSETDARARGHTVRVAKLGMDAVARALERDEPRGFIKVVVDGKSDKILGCAVLGIEGGEIMSMLEIAMLGGVTATTLRETIFAHPTLAEALNNLFWNFEV